MSVCPPLLFRGPCFVSNKRGGGAQLFGDRSLAVRDFIVNIIVYGCVTLINCTYIFSATFERVYFASSSHSYLLVGFTGLLIYKTFCIFQAS